VSAGGALADQLGRPLRSLRVSVTDRCNLRCNYCMPQEEYVWLPREELLTFEEIARLVEVFHIAGRRRRAPDRGRAAVCAAIWAVSFDCWPPIRAFAISR